MRDEHLIQIRKDFHKYPELSGQEVETSKKIISYFKDLKPTKIIQDLGGNGVAIIYEFDKTGPAIMFRCEMDALPILESNHFDHKSIVKGVSHKCGHDGHMAIMIGLGKKLKTNPKHSGKIILLFQPSEENGKGANKILVDNKFKELVPDYIFALHNIPGIPLNEIILPTSRFSASVISFALSLFGKEAHASEPENGINPSLTMAELTLAFDKMIVQNQENDNFTLFTPIFLSLGKMAYGISAGNGEMHYTCRTWTETNMQVLKANIVDVIIKTTKKHGLNFELNWFEMFPESLNDSYCIEIINKAAEVNHISIKKSGLGFKFGEDFGYFSQQFPAAMFGIGAGLNCASLHHNDYDFPDDIIETGVQMFNSILDSILNKAI
jgi:amidohydrolase